MRKSLLKSLLAAFALLLVCGNVWGETYSLVTDASTLKAGDVIVIGNAAKGKVATAMGTSAFMNVGDATFEDGQITLEDAYEITLGGDASAWTLTTSEGNLGTTAAKKMSYTEGTTTWAISIDSKDYSATIASTNSAHGRILYNVNSPRFLNYTSSASASMLLPQIYKKGTGTSIKFYTLTAVVNPTDAGTIALDNNKLEAGKSATASVEAFAGYKFVNWSITGTGATLSTTTETPTTVTIGTADATITANFEAKVLADIELKGMTTDYYTGDTFVFNGKLYAIYTDESKSTVSPTSVSDVDMTTAGEKTVTVTYTWKGVTKTATYTINVTQKEVLEGVTYDFSEINFDEVGADEKKVWSTSYAEHKIEYEEANVIFSSAAKQTSTITDIPVTKGSDVELILTNGLTISDIQFNFRQWGTKEQTIKLSYSTNGGVEYGAVVVTSKSFSIQDTDIPENVNAVKVTFSSASNQIGVESVTFTLGPAHQEEKVLQSIAVSGQKTEFTVKDTFEFGGTVTATYTDETTADVTSSATFSGYDMSKTGEQTVTVTVKSKTTTYTINVKEAKPETLTIADAKKLKDGTSVEVSGTIAAVSQNCYLITDGKDYLLIYGSYLDETEVNVADIVTVSGKMATYNGARQLSGPTTVVTGTDATFVQPTATVYNGAALEAWATATAPITTYIQLSGNLTISGNYYNMTVDGTTTYMGSLIRPTQTLSNGETTVKGYLLYMSGTKYANIIVTEVVNNDIEYTTVTLNSNGYATFTGKTHMELVEGAKAYYATECEDGVVTFTEVSKNIFGSRGVLLAGEPGATVKLMNTTTADKPETDLLWGFTEDTAVSDLDAESDWYALKGNEFLKLDGGTLKAGKAALRVKKATDSSSALTIRFGGTTMIEKMLQDNGDAVIYDMLGRRVENATKGIYIVNGKKVLVK